MLQWLFMWLAVKSKFLKVAMETPGPHHVSDLFSHCTCPPSLCSVTQAFLQLLDHSKLGLFIYPSLAQNAPRYPLRLLSHLQLAQLSHQISPSHRGFAHHPLTHTHTLNFVIPYWFHFIHGPNHHLVYCVLFWYTHTHPHTPILLFLVEFKFHESQSFHNPQI